MTDPWLALTVGLASGALLGAGYFAALWWTVRQLPRRRRPGRWLALSALGRGAALLAGFVALARAHPLALLAALVGFLLARLVATRMLGPADRTASGPDPAASRRDAEGGAR